MLNKPSLMKRTLTTFFSLISLYVMGQDAIPQVFTPPLTGFNRIRDENPYMLMEQATDATGTTWQRYNMLIRTKSPILNKTIEDRTSVWENNTWKDQFVQKDSFITEADLTTIKTDFNYYSYDFSTFSFAQKSKYTYTNDAGKRPTQIIVQSANPPTSNSYQNYYKLTIQYNSTGQRIKDSYLFYSPASTTSTNYTYNDQNQVTARYSFNEMADSSGKGFYTYSPEHRILNFIQFSYDEDLADWTPSSADTLEYNATGQITKYTRYVMMSFNGGNAVFGPYNIEEYQYTATGKLKEVLTRNWDDNIQSWVLSGKMVYTYVNEKPTIGYFYNSTDGITISPNPSYRYTFAPMTGIGETHSILSNVSIYPNPGNEILTIDLGKNSGTATLVDSKGQVAITQTLDGKTTLNTAELTPGIYLLRLQSGDELTTRKVIINH